MSRFLEIGRLRFLILVLSMVGSLIFLSGCGGAADADTSNANPTTIDDWLPVNLEDKSIEIQIAFKQHELSKGLMFRNSMGEQRGMLFYYDPPKQMSFYMRNTKIPLDIGYFTSDGVLREIYPMYPMDERSVKSRRDDILMALEMNQGWYAENGVKPGAAFDLPTLKKALLSRGIPESRIPF